MTSFLPSYDNPFSSPPPKLATQGLCSSLASPTKAEDPNRTLHQDSRFCVCNDPFIHLTYEWKREKHISDVTTAWVAHPHGTAGQTKVHCLRALYFKSPFLVWLKGGAIFVLLSANLGSSATPFFCINFPKTQHFPPLIRKTQTQR